MTEQEIAEINNIITTMLTTGPIGKEGLPVWVHIQALVLRTSLGEMLDAMDYIVTRVRVGKETREDL